MERKREGNGGVAVRAAITASFAVIRPRYRLKIPHYWRCFTKKKMKKLLIAPFDVKASICYTVQSKLS